MWKEGGESVGIPNHSGPANWRRARAGSVDVAAAVSKFSQTQTALQAAYSTTNKLESKTLFDYLT